MYQVKQLTIFRMKKFIYIAIISLIAVACNKGDNEPKPDKKFEVDKFFLIKPATATLKDANPLHKTPLEIVRSVYAISFRNERAFGNQDVGCAFSDFQRDTLANPAQFKRWSTDLINADGMGIPYLVKDFIYAENIVYFVKLPNDKRDTVAYTPNAVMRKMEADVTLALQNKDTVLANKTFRDAMTFTPITGAEWRELKRQNKQ